MRSITALVLVTLSALSHSSDVVIKTGFLTGNLYRTLSEDNKRKYAMGVVDGVFLAPFFGASKQNLSWLESCLSRMQDDQIVAILDKYLSENPVRWHESMNALSYFAFKNACPK